MWKVYLRQIRRLLRENKFFSVVYIIGTALSITMVMLILITYHINTGNVGVEDKRDRMLYLTRSILVDAEWNASSGEDFYAGFRGSSPLSYKFMEKHMYPLRTPETKSIVGQAQSVFYNKNKQIYEEKGVTGTDANYWKIFSMRFLAGRPFTEAEVKSKARKVVLDESTARSFFGTTDVIDYPVLIDWKEYRVCGVVEDVPTYLSDAYSHAWFPYTTGTDDLLYTVNYGGIEDAFGNMKMYILAHDAADQDKIRREMEHQVQAVNAPSTQMKFYLNNQPYKASEAFFASSDTPYEQIADKMVIVLVVIAVLLILPALNLSGLIVARMRKRGEEIAVRKAFGASVWNIMGQLFWENFVQMLIGGARGLCLSFGLFQLFRETLLTSYFSMNRALSVGDSDVLQFFHVVNLSTICYVIVICFLLNLLSTLVPAWRYARISIVDALNKK